MNDRDATTTVECGTSFTRFLPLLLALWWPATLFFAGSIGWWNDDYFFCGRDPATGDIRFLVQTAANPFAPPESFQFWRPLNFLFTTSLITLFWEHPWVVHTIGALAHLLAAVLLYRVLARFRLSPQACMFGSLILLCCPAGFEAIHWASAIATSVSTSMLLGVILLYTRHARHDLSRAGMFALISLGIAIPLVNEQPAACLAALPLLYFAMRPGDEPLARASVRAILPLLPIALCHAAYVAVIAKVLPATSYGSANSFATLEQLPHRLGLTWTQMYKELAFFNLGFGALREGARAMLANWPLAAVALAALFVGLFVSRSIWFSPAPSPRTGEPLHRRAWFLAFAFATYWLTLFPLAACLFVHVRPRMAYPSAAALAILAAIIGNALRDAVVSRRNARSDGTQPTSHRLALAYHTATALLALPLALGGVVMLVGVQSGYRARHAADRRSAEALHALFPDVPPATAFLPMSVDNSAVHSGTPRFDWYFCSAWNWSYSYPTLIQREYRRTDIIGAMGDPGFQLITPVSDDVFLFGAPMLPNLPRDPDTGKVRLQWSRAVTFDVAADGRITLLSPITLVRGNVPVAEIRPALVEALRDQPGIVMKPFTQRVP